MDKKILIAGMATFLLPPHAEAQDNRPNILFIMCDDMGYGDLACYGQKYISTPNIDRLAADGMRFTQAYAGSPVSAPSRACVMTGQHTGHTHVRGNREHWSGQIMYGQNADYAVSGQEPYDTCHVILPEIFKQNGYATGMFGKWAGGYEGSISTPDKRGIDEFYGYICQYQAHLYFPNFLNRYSSSKGDKGVVREELTENTRHAMYGPDYDNRTQYSADIIHSKALEWLDSRQVGQPFLGIFTYTLPHAELRQPEDSILKGYRNRFADDKTFGGNKGSRYNPTLHTHAEFAAMITRLDTQVGEIIEKLREKGLENNTVIIFTSDNGPHEEGGADPEFFNRDGLLRGLKRSTYEGGIRVPFIVKWPEHINAGKDCDMPFAFYDLLPTFCDIVGIKDFKKRYTNKNIPDDCFDGISIYPTLTGKGKQRHHKHLYWEFHETDMIAVRKGDWKLVVKKGKPMLYNLAADLHEDRDVAAENPRIVRKMTDIIYKEHRPSEFFRITLPPKTQ